MADITTQAAEAADEAGESTEQVEGANEGEGQGSQAIADILDRVLANQSGEEPEAEDDEAEPQEGAQETPPSGPKPQSVPLDDDLIRAARRAKLGDDVIAKLDPDTARAVLGAFRTKDTEIDTLNGRLGRLSQQTASAAAPAAAQEQVRVGQPGGVAAGIADAQQQTGDLTALKEKYAKAYGEELANDIVNDFAKPLVELRRWQQMQVEREEMSQIQNLERDAHRFFDDGNRTTIYGPNEQSKRTPEQEQYRRDVAVLAYKMDRAGISDNWEHALTMAHAAKFHSQAKTEAREQLRQQMNKRTAAVLPRPSRGGQGAPKSKDQGLSNIADVLDRVLSRG